MRLLLPCIPDIEMVAIDGIERLCKYHKIDSDRIDEAKILVSEVIINAMEHGKSGDSEQPTEVQFDIDNKQIVISVRDHGPGFKIEEIPVPNIDEKIKAKNKRGWGLQLMRSLADDISINSGPNGTQVVLTLKL